MSDDRRDPEREAPEAEAPTTAPPGAADTTDGGAEAGEKSRGPLGFLGAAVREVVLVLAMAMVLSFVVKTWFIQAFYIPSGSMEDTLLVGDRVVVSKLTPGPIDLQRGDVIVFQDPGDWLDTVPLPERTGIGGRIHDALVFVGLLPSESEDHLIKRVIGLPGDHVSCCDDQGRVMVNGQPVDETYVRTGDAPSSLEFDITVPANRVWVMGDHRSDSEDSRYHDPNRDGAQGSVPVPDITGRAVAIVWPFERFSWLTDHPEVFAGVPDPVAEP